MKKLSLSALIALSAFTSGCGTTNRGLESVHQPVVSRNDYVLDVGSGGGALRASEIAQLSGWFESLRVGYGDHVALDVPGGADSPAIREAVGAIAARYGLLLDDTAPITTGDIAPGAVRVVISRLKAEVPNCPDWSRPSSPNFNNNTNSNYGCATNTNLAAMVANPEDFIRGQTGNGQGDTSASGRAIGAYRSGTVKPVVSESTGGR